MKIYLESTIFILILTTIGVKGKFFCKKKERFSICGNNECRRPTCNLPRDLKFCDPKCRPGCICLKGLVRREMDKKCVKLRDCSKSRSLRTFLQRSRGYLQKKKQNPRKRPHTARRRCPSCRRRFLKKGRNDVKKRKPGYLLENEDDNNNKTKLIDKLKKEFEKALNETKEAVEKGKGLKDDVIKKLKEIREKMKKNKVEIEKKAKDLIEKIKKKVKDAEKKILDKITGSNKENEATTTTLFPIILHPV